MEEPDHVPENPRRPRKRPGGQAAAAAHRQLARQVGAELLLLHVADGWAARNFDQLKLAESEEMKADRDYLENTAAQLRASGLQVDTLLALGNPPNEIVQDRREVRLRSHRPGLARPQAHRRYRPRQHDRQGSPQRDGAAAGDQCGEEDGLMLHAFGP